MPSARGVTSAVSAGDPPPGNLRSVRSEVRWRRTTEPSRPVVTKLRSRVEEAIERTAEPWPSNSWALTISRSASALGRARNHAESPPCSSPTITLLPPSAHSTAVRGTELILVASVSCAFPLDRSQW